jgi:xylan 1,4-beta-xylosidase
MSIKTKQFLLILTCAISASQLFSQSDRTITLNYNNEKGILNCFFNECVGADRANEGLRALVIRSIPLSAGHRRRNAQHDA